MTEELTADQFGAFDEADLEHSGAMGSQVTVGALDGIGIDPIERRGSLLTAQNIFGSIINHNGELQGGLNASVDELE